jgi:hypothetical protein
MNEGSERSPPLRPTVWRVNRVRRPSRLDESDPLILSGED